MSWCYFYNYDYFFINLLSISGQLICRPSMTETFSAFRGDWEDQNPINQLLSLWWFLLVTAFRGCKTFIQTFFASTFVCKHWRKRKKTIKTKSDKNFAFMQIISSLTTWLNTGIHMKELAFHQLSWLFFLYWKSSRWKLPTWLKTGIDMN